MTLDELIETLEKTVLPMTFEAVKGDTIRFLKQLRDQPEIIRCKDCRHFSMTTLGMKTGACWRNGSTVWGETGEHARHHCCIRVDSPEHYCSYAERLE